MTTTVVIHAAVCLRSRLRNSGCSACAQICPVACVRTDGDVPRLDAGCTGCGRCAAVCPMGAISVPGFEIDAERLSLHSSPVLRIACARAPADAHVRVPCLGGLADSDLLWLHAQLPAATRVELDDGGCARCDSGRGDGHPAAAALARTAELMAQAGVPPERRPRLAQHKADASRRLDPLQSLGRARRGLLGALLPAPERVPAAMKGSWRKPAPARARMLAALRVIAARAGGQVAEGLFHALEVAAECRGHRVCAAACPTGALVRYRDEAAGRAGIAFDTEHCIGCGQCAAACAAGALRLRPGRGRPRRGLVALTAHGVRECADCGARFFPGSEPDATRCGRCERSAQLARAAFATLFPRNPPLQGMESIRQEHR